LNGLIKCLLLLEVNIFPFFVGLLALTLADVLFSSVFVSLIV
jgi:hypothetical protein